MKKRTRHAQDGPQELVDSSDEEEEVRANIASEETDSDDDEELNEVLKLHREGRNLNELIEKFKECRERR